MKPLYKLIAAIVTTCSLLAIPAHSFAQDIVIGQSISLQDGKNAYGTGAMQGIQLYFKIANEAGGIGGRKLVLKTLDDKGKAAVAEENARKLLADGATILFGSIEGGPSMAVAKVAQEKKVALFGPMAGAPGLRQPHKPYIFPVRAAHRSEFRKLLSHAVMASWPSFAFFHADNDNGRQHLSNVKLEAESTGAKLVLAMPYKDDITDAQLDAYVEKMRAAKVQAVLNHGSPLLLERLVLRAKALSFHPAFLAVNSGSSEVAQHLGKQAHGLMFAQIVPPPTAQKFPIVREFQEAWNKHNRGKPYGYGALEGYITSKALAQALTRTKGSTDPEVLATALYSAPISFGGFTATYSPGAHTGSMYVDTTVVDYSGKHLY